MLSWKECGVELLKDKASADWQSQSSTFNSWALGHAERYGKTPGALARILRIVNFYQDLRDSFELPDFGLIPEGVSASALNDFSRLIRVLGEEDKQFLVKRIKAGDLSTSHTASLLETYKKSMLETSPRGRPFLDENKQSLKRRADATLDAVAIIFLKSHAEWPFNPDGVKTILDCSEASAYGRGLMPEKLWLATEESKKGGFVVGLSASPSFEPSEKVLRCWADLFQYLISVAEEDKQENNKDIDIHFEQLSVSESFIWKNKRYVARFYKSLKTDSLNQEFVTGILSMIRR